MVVVYLVASHTHALADHTLGERHGEHVTPLTPHSVAFNITALLLVRVLVLTLFATASRVPVRVALAFAVAMAMQCVSIVSFARGSTRVALATSLLLVAATEVAHALLERAIATEEPAPRPLDSPPGAAPALLLAVSSSRELTGVGSHGFSATLAGYATWAAYSSAVVAVELASATRSRTTASALAIVLVLLLSVAVAAHALVVRSATRLLPALWSLATILARQQGGAERGVVVALYVSLAFTGGALFALLLRALVRFVREHCV